MLSINHPSDQPPATLCCTFYISWHRSQNIKLFCFSPPLSLADWVPFFFLCELCHLDPLPRWWSICPSLGRLLPTSERARRSWWRLRLWPSMVSCRLTPSVLFRGVRVTQEWSQRNAKQSRMQSLCCAAAVGGSWFNQVCVPFSAKLLKTPRW